MGNFRLYVLNQRQIYSMENYYPDVLADDLTLGKAVIITAPVKPEDERATYQNRLFREGGKISFGWLDTEAGFEEAVADPSLIGYEQVDFTISEVIEEAGDTPTKWAMGMRAANVIVIISEETAKSTGLCDWASSVKVTMNVSVTEKQYNAVKTRFREMKEESFGVMQSVPKTAEYDTSVLETVGLVQNFLMGVLSAFMLYAMFTVLHGAFARHRRSFGILRATGYRKKALFGTILLEFLFYWLELCLISFGVVFLIEMVYFPNFPYEYWPSALEGFPYVLRTAAAQTAVFGTGALLLCILAAVLFTHSLWKKRIAPLIRSSE